MNNTTRGAVSYLGHEFDDFLFAPIGEERNGMLLTVLSVLARRNVDPWQEASQLTGLPEKTAIDRLQSLMKALPNDLSVNPDVEALTARLIKLLPRRTDSGLPSREQSSDADTKNILLSAISYVIFVACVLVTLNPQWIAASQQSPVQAGNAHAAELQHNLPVNPSLK